MVLRIHPHGGETMARGRPLKPLAVSPDTRGELASLARSLGVDMPITEEVRAVIEDGRPAAAAYRALLDRPPTSESRQ